MNISNSYLPPQYMQIIDWTIQSESTRLYELEDQQTEISKMKSVVSDFDSKLNTLHGDLKTLTAEFSNPFEAMTGSVSDDAGFSVSANSSANAGSYTLSVERLAKSDTRVSKDYDGASSDLRTFFDNNGQQTFSIEVASPTDADANNRETISVTVDPTGTTNEEILGEIQNAIGQAMDDAVAAEQITREEATNANVIKETSSDARLSLRSGKTGYANRLQFTDSAGGLLAALEVTANQQASGTAGGYITDPGTDETSQLNAKVTLDGLTLYRSANRIDDALEGVTINLDQAQGTSHEFSVTSDKSHIKSKVESFIKNYNAILSFIESKSRVDGESGFRGQMAGDALFSGLRYRMRNVSASEVGSQAAGEPSTLRAIGIDINDDGTLSLADEKKLMEIVEKNPTAVQALFGATDGIGTRLMEQLNMFTDNDGLIDQREDTYQARERRLKDRITMEEERLNNRRNHLIQEYAQLQKSMSSFQGQQSMLGNFMNFGF